MIAEILNIWNTGFTPLEFTGFIAAFLVVGIAFMKWLSIKLFRRKK